MSEILLGKFDGEVKDEGLLSTINEKISKGEFDIKDLEDVDVRYHNQVASELIYYGYFGVVSDNLGSFEELSIDIALKVINYCNNIAENIDSFVDSSHKEIAMHIINDVNYHDYGRFNIFAKNVEKFKGLDNEVALKLIEVGEVDFLKYNLSFFSNLNQEILLLLAEKENKNRHGGTCSMHLELWSNSFAKYDKNTALWLMENGFGKLVASNLDKVEGLDEEIMNIFIEWGKMGANKYMHAAVEVNIKLAKPNSLLDVAYSDFGGNLSYDIYDMYKELDDSGNLSSEMIDFGINNIGAVGINELRNKFRKMQKDLLNRKLNPELLKLSIIRKWLMTVVRYNLTYELNDEENFVSKIKKYIEVKDEYGQLSPEYQPSKVLNIDSINKEKQEDFKYSEQFLSRYSTLLISIKEARNLIDNEKGLNILVDRIKKKEVKF